MLKSRRDILNHAAETLLESETIQGEELSALEAAVLKKTDLTSDRDVSENCHALAAQSEIYWSKGFRIVHLVHLGENDLNALH